MPRTFEVFSLKKKFNEWFYLFARQILKTIEHYGFHGKNCIIFVRINNNIRMEISVTRYVSAEDQLRNCPPPPHTQQLLKLPTIDIDNIDK
jgi:hypothetical protein